MQSTNVRFSERDLAEKECSVVVEFVKRWQTSVIRYEIKTCYDTLSECQLLLPIPPGTVRGKKIIWYSRTYHTCTVGVTRVRWVWISWCESCVYGWVRCLRGHTARCAGGSFWDFCLDDLSWPRNFSLKAGEDYVRHNYWKYFSASHVRKAKRTKLRRAW